MRFDTNKEKGNKLYTVQVKSTGCKTKDKNYNKKTL